ncbi:hypothetical protein P280DRAFT_550761 [Massarina eburnea CBS 473.64]|uniref:Uncharacterized protein n=1 Tax=Massarina eburnea CBS 473.64 TaxID=1395130 RepID=A0A6A6RWD6_9PLEO|nr:hypothetical protein P280DRAFT_550761 [Massarina eburnea CBS 473.64]
MSNNCLTNPETQERDCADENPSQSSGIPSSLTGWNPVTSLGIPTGTTASVTGEGGGESTQAPTPASSTSAPISSTTGGTVPNANHPNTSNLPATSPTTATAIPSSSGIAPGAVAGIAIATTILGAAIAFIAAFFIFKRHRDSQKAYGGTRETTPDLVASLKGEGNHKSYVSISQSIATPPAAASSLSLSAKRNGEINLASLANSSDFLASVLPAAADEVTVKNRCATLFNQILHHVESYYRDVDATITPTMEHDLARFGSESLSMVGILRHSAMPTMAIKHALAGFIMSIVSPEGEEQATLFPTEITGIKRNERSTERPEDHAAYILYKRLSVHLHTPDIASIASQQSDIREAAGLFALTFFPWANPSLSEQEKDEDLAKIMRSALDISIWLYGQPYQYEFMWEDVGFRGTAITPGLTRTTDSRGRIVILPLLLTLVLAIPTPLPEDDPNNADTHRVPIAAMVRNNCPFSIWVYQTIKASCEPQYPSTKYAEVKPNSQLWLEKLSYNNSCGMSVKMGRTRQDLVDSNVYQIEYVIDPSDRIWYNLSHVNGNPFQGLSRSLNVVGTGPRCHPFYCLAGDDGSGCDWRASTADQFVGTCDHAEDIKFFLC